MIHPLRLSEWLLLLWRSSCSADGAGVVKWLRHTGGMPVQWLSVCCVLAGNEEDMTEWTEWLPSHTHICYNPQPAPPTSTRPLWQHHCKIMTGFKWLFSNLLYSIYATPAVKVMTSIKDVLFLCILGCKNATWPWWERFTTRVVVFLSWAESSCGRSCVV